jgi:hypothetical protein
MIQQQHTGNFKKTEQAPPRGTAYQANSFAITRPEGWQDSTIHTLTGPVHDGIQHNVIITAAGQLPFTSVREFAEWHILASGQELRGCRLLKKEPMMLACGMPAYKAIFTWSPTETLKVYQEQVFVLVEQTGYVLTAAFSKASRKTLGPQVEGMMLSFVPQKTAAKQHNVSRQP